MLQNSSLQRGGIEGVTESQIAEHELHGISEDPLQATENLSKSSPEFTGSAKQEVGGEESESAEARIERLGRERPEKFPSSWAEIGFCFSICMSQILTEYFVSGFNVILPTLAVALDIPAAASTWPASAFSLVVSSFLLCFGRFADMYGGYPVYVIGLAWLFVWSLIAGFSTNQLMLDFCRALQGLGPAAFLPSGIMLLGSIYRPGPRKNLVFSIYGACAPFGFFIGIFFAGLAGEFTRWGWYFWIGAILTIITTITAYLTVPSDIQERKGMGVKMDWLGALFIVPGLILVVFSITDSSHAPSGWRTPYIYILLIIGFLLLAIAAYIEGRIASMPLLPFDLFHVPSMKPLIIALFFTYGSLGVYLLYATFYTENIMSATPLQVVAWYVPMCLGGCLISTVGGFVLHLLPGTILLIVAGVAWILAPLLFAIAPVGANYWAYVFPSMICATIGIDVTFNITNVFITTSMPRRRQGLAGALINSVLHLGISFFLGLADVTATQTAHLGQRRSYKSVFWYETACAATALVVLVGFVKIQKAKSDMTADEKREAEEVQMAMAGVGATAGGEKVTDTSHGRKEVDGMMNDEDGGGGVGSPKA
ncbi:MAG: hypothetical protein M1827_006582 [Pycnora praestabilis]|nr:MAG: hypothetical protein M1827_006582 [Pycnora praestabilis]